MEGRKGRGRRRQSAALQIVKKRQDKKGEKGREKKRIEVETMEGLHDSEKKWHGTIARTLR